MQTCQVPSAIVLSLSSLMSRRVPDVRNQLDISWHHMHTLASFLVIIGKSLNFALFCLSSCSFRRHLLQMLRDQARRRSLQQSTLTSYLIRLFLIPFYAFLRFFNKKTHYGSILFVFSACSPKTPYSITNEHVPRIL